MDQSIEDEGQKSFWYVGCLQNTSEAELIKDFHHEDAIVDSIASSVTYNNAVKASLTAP